MFEGGSSWKGVCVDESATGMGKNLVIQYCRHGIA